jgi:hypothetical protein
MRRFLINYSKIFSNTGNSNEQFKIKFVAEIFNNKSYTMHRFSQLRGSKTG